MAATKKSKTFLWQARSRSGRKLSGENIAPNISVLNAFLVQQGLTDITIKEKAKPLFAYKGGIKAKHILFFTRQMSAMLNSGIPVLKALDLIYQTLEKPIRLKEIIASTREDVENGFTLSESLSNHPNYFNKLYTSLVAAGEASGTLENAMQSIAVDIEKSEATKKKVKRALQYPTIVLLFSMVTMIILMVKVVPSFSAFYASNGGQLPDLTLFVISLSNFLIDNGLYLLALLGGIILLFLYLKKRSMKVQLVVSQLLFRLPFIGAILKIDANARFARTMASLFDAGVSILTGLHVVAPTTGNIIFEAAINEIREGVQNGQEMSFAMRNTGLFLPVAVQMVAIGEETGALGSMLGRIAFYYEEELDWRVDNLTALIEPFIMVFLAVIVGGLLIAMYLPIINMGSLF